MNCERILYKKKIDSFFKTNLELKYNIQFVYEITPYTVKIHPIIDNFALTSAFCFNASKNGFEIEEPKEVLKQYLVENNIKISDLKNIIHKLQLPPYSNILDYFFLKNNYYRLTNHENLYIQLEI
jgi:hypothetical protein